MAAAVDLRIKADGLSAYKPAARFEAAISQFVSVPIDLVEATNQVFLLVYGSGIRGRSALATVSADIGGITAQVEYADHKTISSDWINSAFVCRKAWPSAAKLN